MPGQSFDSLHRYAATLPDRPATFAERGVAVPFTAPMLAAARLRRMPGGSPELLLPALGGRGVYILGWDACLGLCAPTLHDRQLWNRLAGLGRPSPASVRAAARVTAMEGWAGRAASRAAAASLATFEAARAAARDELAARGCPVPDGLAEALAEAGPLLATRLAAIGQTVEELEGWAPTLVAPADRRTALLLSAAARLALSAARGSVEALRAILAQRPWRIGTPELLALAERPDWVIDGWDGPAALWRASARVERATLLGDMLAGLPAPPLEADGLPGPVADWDGLLRTARHLARGPSCGAEGRVALVARNEAARALAA